MKKSLRRVTKLVLADDQTVVRQGLRCYLERQKDFKVVGESADGLEVASLVQRLRPDVLVMDVALPGMYGLEVARLVRRETPRTRVVVLSRYVNEWYVTEALRHGATAYVLKQADGQELVRAIRNVTRGER